MRAWLGLLVLVACDGEPLGGVDAPCETNADCEAGLECDDSHGAATCQEPHDHPVGGGDPSGGAASTGGGGGGAPTACEAYCACLDATCASFPSYPFADEPACLAACEGFTTDELSCFGAFCEQASTGTPTEHQCEHAWGDGGTAEC
ncbi:MAG: hypothetical protein JNK04_01495 [Myxococcales bacterium]|nr:hypothetical protein [Myxococcales bacterium]